MWVAFPPLPALLGRQAGTYKASQLTSPRTLWPSALVFARRANVPEVAGRKGAPSLIPSHTYALQCFRPDWPPYWASCGRPESTLVPTWRHQLLARGRPALWLQDLHGTQLCHMVWLMANAADLTRSYPIREDSGCMEAGVNLLPEHTRIQGCMLAKMLSYSSHCAAAPPVPPTGRMSTACVSLDLGYVPLHRPGSTRPN